MTAQQQQAHCPHSELAVGWALHVLEPDEEILVVAHLTECDECTRTVAETELVGATLGLAVPQETPSAELEQRILALTSTPQIAPEPSPKPAPAPVPPPTPDVVPRPAQPGARTRPTPPLSVPKRMSRPRPRRDPLCVPDLLKLIAVALLVFLFAAAVVFLAIP